MELAQVAARAVRVGGAAGAHAASDRLGAIAQLTRPAVTVVDAAVGTIRKFWRRTRSLAIAVQIGGALSVVLARRIRVQVWKRVSARYVRRALDRGLSMHEAVAFDQSIALVFGVLTRELVWRRRWPSSAGASCARCAAAVARAASVGASGARTAHARTAHIRTTLFGGAARRSGIARSAAVFEPRGGPPSASELRRTQCRKECSPEQVQASAKHHHRSG